MYMLKGDGKIYLLNAVKGFLFVLGLFFFNCIINLKWLVCNRTSSISVCFLVCSSGSLFRKPSFFHLLEHRSITWVTWHWLPRLHGRQLGMLCTLENLLTTTIQISGISLQLICLTPRTKTLALTHYLVHIFSTSGDQVLDCLFH